MTENENNPNNALVSPFEDAAAITRQLEEDVTTTSELESAGDAIVEFVKLIQPGKGSFKISPLVLGTQKEELSPDNTYVVDTSTVKYGFSGWPPKGDGELSSEPPQEVFVDWYAPKPEQPHDWMKPAVKFNATILRSPNEEQVGKYIGFSANQKMAYPEYIKIVAALRKRWQSGEHESIYPVVQVGFEKSYVAARRSEYHKPVVVVANFMTAKEVTMQSIADAAGVADPEPVESPRAARRR